MVAGGTIIGIAALPLDLAAVGLGAAGPIAGGAFAASGSFIESLFTGSKDLENVDSGDIERSEDSDKVDSGENEDSENSEK